MSQSTTPRSNKLDGFIPSNGAMIVCCNGTGDYVKREDYLQLESDLQAAQARIGELEKMLNWFRGRSVDEVVSVICDDGDGATLDEAIQTAIQNSNK